MPLECKFLKGLYNEVRIVFNNFNLQQNFKWAWYGIQKHSVFQLKFSNKEMNKN